MGLLRNKAGWIVSFLLFTTIAMTPQTTSATPGEHLVDAVVATDLISFLEDFLRKDEVEGDSEASSVASPVPASAHLMSRYGVRPGRTTGRATFHAGLDFEAPRGTPTSAVRPGVVEIVTRNASNERTFAGYGNSVVIYHEDEDLWTFYAHLDEVLVSPGMKVEAGQVIGRVGNTTNGRFLGMGVHLHFEVRERGRDGASPFPGPYRVNNLDPERWLLGHGLAFDHHGVMVQRESSSENT